MPDPHPMAATAAACPRRDQVQCGTRSGAQLTGGAPGGLRLLTAGGSGRSITGRLGVRAGMPALAVLGDHR